MFKRITSLALALVISLTMLSAFAAESDKSATASDKNDTLALNNARILKYMLKAPDSMVLKQDIAVFGDAASDLYSLICFTAQNAYGVSVYDEAIFKNNTFLGLYDELQSEYDRLINKAQMTREEQERLIEIRKMQLNVEIYLYEKNFTLVSGESIAEQLEIKYDPQ